ncbi:MAG: DUF222 domain-containing protein [Microbacterium sp.]|uniref:HNH endonuclease signature motif containing protein n=1 Tax=Microbacterium sp. TaxID=51671 RepID=UPI0039E23797
MLVSELVDTRRRIAAAQADEARLLAAAVELMLARAAQLREQPDHHVSSADLPLREIAAELAAAIRVSDRTIQRRMGDAATLLTGYPAVFAAWQEGRVDAGHVAAILDGGDGLDDDRRTRYERAVLVVAEHESAGRVRGLAREIAARVDPDGATARIRRRQSDRFVRVTDLGEGISRLLADLPTPLAHAIYDRLTRMARATTADSPDPASSHPRHPDAEVPDPDEGSNAAEPAIAQPDPAAATPADGWSHDAQAVDAPPDDQWPDDAARPDALPPGDVPPDVPRDRWQDDEVPPDAPPDDDDPPETVTTAPTPDATRGRRGNGEDPRTMDQRRADILTDMLLAAAPVAHGTGLASITGHVQITIPVLTAAGHSHQLAIIPGHGPIDASTARHLAANTPAWERVMTDPHTGAVLAVDRYRVPADLTRFLRARDERCRFPGCGRTAHGCDLDHTHDAAHGGKTSAANLAHLCRRHHTLKHQTAWRVRQLGGGVLEWTAPTGRHHYDRPPSIVRFVPTDDEPLPV